MHNKLQVAEALKPKYSDSSSALKDPAAIIELRNVRYSSQAKLLLKNIDLKISRGGITAVMGYNGAGKSLLIKILHGILQADTGDVLWDGELANSSQKQSEAQKQAMVFQKPTLLRRSVKANLMFSLNKQTKLSAIEKCVALLDLVRLAHLADNPARRLSGGEQQRLALARALASKPDVLFLDEATASLDPASASVIEDIVIKQKQQGVKIIMVTHDVAQAERLADDVILLHRGEVVEQALASCFFNNPKTQVAKAYLSGQLWND